MLTVQKAGTKATDFQRVGVSTTLEFEGTQ